MARLAVLGAGAWGTAIACALAARHEVQLWARDATQARAMEKSRRNERYLPGIEIPAAVKLTTDLPKNADLLLAATPVAGLRELAAGLPADSSLVWLCKGFEAGTGNLPHQIVKQPRRSPTRWRAACPAR